MKGLSAWTAIARMTHVKFKYWNQPSIWKIVAFCQNVYLFCIINKVFIEHFHWKGVHLYDVKKCTRGSVDVFISGQKL